MPRAIPYECCGAIYAQSGGNRGGEPPRFCRDCPNRFFLIARWCKKPEGCKPGQLLHIDDLIEIKGVGK